MFTPTNDQHEVITRFCALAGMVAESEGWKVSADCICATPVHSLTFSHQVIAKIERIVLDSIGRTRDDLAKFNAAE